MKRTMRPDYKAETTALFKRINLSDSAVAKYLDIHVMTVGRWRRGETSPGRAHFEKLTEFVHQMEQGRPVSSEAQVAGQPAAPSKLINVVRIPLLGSIPVENAFDNSPERVGELCIPGLAIGGNYSDCFALWVIEKGAAFAKASVGDILIFKRKPRAEPAQWVLVRTKSDFSFRENSHTLSKDETIIAYCIGKYSRM